jgi:hypothetical protein
MKKKNTDNINIKIFLIVSTFYSTIIQTLFSIYYVTFVLLILLFIISYKEIFKELSNVKNKDYILLAPLFFLVYIVVQCFFYIKNINYNAIYIIGSSFVSIFYFYIFFFNSSKKNFLQNFYKILFYSNLLFITLIFASKSFSNLIRFYNLNINLPNLSEIFVTSYFSMIINIFTVFYLIKNISIRFLNLPLLISILFIFFSSELKIILFIFCFSLLSLFISKFKNRYIISNVLIIFFISIYFFLAKIPGPNEKFEYFSTYTLKSRINHFLAHDFNSLYKNYNEKDFHIFLEDEVNQINQMSKSLSSRVANYGLFAKQVFESSALQFFFGHGAFFNGQFYFHNFFLDIFIKFGFLTFMAWVLYYLFFLSKYFSLIKKNFSKFLFTPHFYCFFLFLYFNLSFPAWHSKILFTFLGISYFLIKHSKKFSSI